MGSVDEPTGRLRPKKEPTFGKKPSRGSFGKKPSQGSFGKTVPQVTLSSGRTKPASRTGFGRRKTKIKKYELVLPGYMKFLHERDGSAGNDVHHWITRSKIGRNDFFVDMVEHNYHINVIHGTMSPAKWVIQEGEEDLLIRSFLLFSEWLASSCCPDFERGFFSEMLVELRAKCLDDPIGRNAGNASDLVKAYAEEYNFTMKDPRK